MDKHRATPRLCVATRCKDLFIASLLAAVTFFANIPAPLFVAPAVASELRLSAEILVDTRGPAPIGKAIAVTSDGGFVVAGSLRASIPWAIRVDRSGSVVWEHLASTDVAHDAKKKSFSQYESVTAIANGSTLLCGFQEVGGTGATPTVGLANLVTNKGDVTSIDAVYPNGDRSFRISRLSQCFKWNELVGVLGTAMRPRSADGAAPDERFFWALAFDREGNKRWEVTLPMRRPFQRIARPFITNDGSVIVLASITEPSPQTDVFKISNTGRLGAQATFEGVYQIVLAESHSANVQIVDFESSQASVLTLDAELQTQRRLRSVKLRSLFSEVYWLRNSDYLILQSKEMSGGTMPVFVDVDGALFPRGDGRLLGGASSGRILASELDEEKGEIAILLQRWESNSNQDSAPHMQISTLRYK